MREEFQIALKTYLHDKIHTARKVNHLTQAEFAEILEMDTRSYADIDVGNSMCGTLTFVLFLVYVCEDPLIIVAEIRKLFEGVKKDAA